MPGRLVEFVAEGMQTLVARLEALSPIIRRKFLLKALLKGGEVVRKRAAEPIVSVPVLSAPIYRHGKLYRKPGTLRDAIKVRTSKDASREGDVGVFVNVRPAKGADRGANSPNDPFYWQWQNFDHRSRSGHLIPGKHFLEKGGQELTGAALTAIEVSLAPDIESLNLPFTSQS